MYKKAQHSILLYCDILSTQHFQYHARAVITYLKYVITEIGLILDSYASLAMASEKVDLNEKKSILIILCFMLFLLRILKKEVKAHPPKLVQ